MISSIRELEVHNQQDPETRALTVAGARPIVDWGLIQLDSGKSEFPVLGGYLLQIFAGHGMYEGAELIVDLKDPEADPATEEDRPFSYAFFPDIVICIEGSLRDPLESTPVHEANFDELTILANYIFSRR